MTNNIFRKIKARNGEKFAQKLKIHAPLALEHEKTIEILRHAGTDVEDVEKISKTLHALLVQDSKKPEEPQCPLKLLDDAGYNAYIVTDRKSQDAIKKYYRPGEELCTFKEDRWKNYHIINAVKKNVDDIKPAAKTKRDDEYGTSVISIQVRGGFISIKNRYNHNVPNCDATFSNNPDNIIRGLKAAIEHKFKVKLSGGAGAPDGFMLIDGVLFKTHYEINGIYYGEKAIIHNGKIVELHDYEFLYDIFVFCEKTKTLRLYDSSIKDSFPDDFNRHYAGKKSLRVDRKGNLCDGDRVIVGVV